MTSPEIQARIADVFKEVFAGKVQFAPDLLRKNEPKWDSMKHVELIIALEKAFGIRMDGADATDIVGAEQLLNVVAGKLA